MSWECPECSSQNSDSIARCVCGYELIESNDNEKIKKDYHYPKTNWKRVIFEAVIIFIATALPTLIMGLFWGNIGPNDNIELIEFKLRFYYASLAIEYIGFIVVGCFHRNNRFSHLFFVALVLWCFSFLNYFIKPFTLADIVNSFIHVMIAVVVGGCISFLFVRPRRKSQI